MQESQSNLGIIFALLVVLIFIALKIIDIIQEIKNSEEYKKDEWRHK